MAKTNLSGKKPLAGNKRSHSMRATRRVQKPNLQTVKLANGKKIRLTARELRALKKAYLI
jgi:large subunit ribosomal protein L28